MTGEQYESKDQWTVRLEGSEPDSLGVFGSEHTFPALEGRHHARASVERWRQNRPDVTATLMRRRVEIHYGPWEPVAD